MLRFSLIVSLALFAWPPAALAQNKGAEALQIFEFDYDQKAAPVVNVPTKAGNSAAAPAKTTPAPAKPATPAKASAPTKAPTCKTSAPTTAPLQSGSPNGVLTIIGESDRPSVRYEEYPPDYQAEEINLSPAGLPATTRVPAKPGEARVEKSRSQPGAAISAAKRPPPATSTARPSATGGTWPGSRPGSIHRFWQAAQNNWARYGGTPHSRPPSLSPTRTAASGVIGHTSTGVPLQELTQFSGF
jgi:hypothetical protein